MELRDARLTDADDELVFVSYSHADREWVRRLLVLLTPLVRNKGLRVWADEHIRVGDDWRRDIETAIVQAKLALLLVSGDFLGSRFIMEEELPALAESGVRLAPVLVHDCLWAAEPLLADVQWIHDPGRDGPLDRATDPGGRDRRLTEICRRLDSELVVSSMGASHPPRQAEALAPVSAVPAPSGQLGALDGVPSLPPGYQPRRELDALVKRLLGPGSGAVGLTGDPAALGLFGQGGVGKTVQATALAHDERVRAAFPDGIYWITLGESDDLLAAQLALLGRLRLEGTLPATPSEARRVLERKLADRRVLLIVDDVWSEAAAAAFRATGADGRVIYTSRDEQVLTAVGARLETVDVLDEATALALLADISGTPSAGLPREAAQVLAGTGRFPLAIALVAAAVRGGLTWKQTARQLARDAETFLDHPYADAFKALQLATAALSESLAEAYMSLAVYPRDTRVPVAAIARYWQLLRDRTPEDTRATLSALAARSLLMLDGGDVAFHDLQHDYLLLRVEDLPLRHADLLSAYERLLPGQEWWALPAGEPYIADHLLHHMIEAGFRGRLLATATDLAYLAVRTARGGPHAAENDLRIAERIAPDDTQLKWMQRWLAQNGHLFTGYDDPTDLAPTFASRLIDPPAGLDRSRLEPLLPRIYLAPLWDTKMPPPRALKRVLSGHRDAVHGMDFSPDSSLLASVGWDQAIRVWDVEDGSEYVIAGSEEVLGGGKEAANRERIWKNVNPLHFEIVVFSPDGGLLASDSPMGSVWLWSVANDGEPLELEGLADQPRSVLFSPDGHLIAGAGRDGTVLLWRVSDGCERHRFKRAYWPVFSSNGRLLAVARRDDGMVGLWDLKTGRERPLVENIDHLSAIAFNPDGRSLAIANRKLPIELWPVEDGGEATKLTGHTASVYELIFSPDGRHLAGVTEDDSFFVWDLAERHGRPLFTVTSRWNETASFSEDGKLLACTDEDGIQLWNVAQGRETARLPVRALPVTQFRFSPDDKLLACAGDDGRIQLWNVEEAIADTRPPDRVEEIFAVAFSPDPDAQLLAGACDGTVRLWDAASGGEEARLPGRTGAVRSFAFGPRGRLIASLGEDNTIRLWDAVGARDGRQPTDDGRQLTDKAKDVFDMAFSPDERSLATSMRHDGTVWLWDTKRGGHTALEPECGCVYGVAFSPDGQLLAIASDDRTAYLWDLSRDRELHRLSHKQDVHGVVFSPNGLLLATTSYTDEPVYLWNVESGREQPPLAGPTEDVHTVVFSADGRLLATVSDRAIQLWDVATRAPLSRLHMGETIEDVAWGTTGIAVATATSITMLGVEGTDSLDES
jgi:WD40 repeat protein